MQGCGNGCLTLKHTNHSQQSFLYGSTVLMASMLAVKLIGALFKIPLTNILGETGMGYFGSAYNLYTTVYALTVTGLSTAVARMTAEQAAQGRWRDVRRLFRMATGLFLLLGLLGSTIVLAAARRFSILINSPHSFWAVVMIAPAIFFCCLMASFRGYYEGLANMTPTAVTQVVEVAVKLAAGLTFAHLAMGAARRQFASTGTVFGVPCQSSEAADMIAVPFGAAGAMLGVSVSTLAGFLYILFRYKLRGDAISPEQIAAAPPPAGGMLSRLIRMAVPITLGAVVLQLSALIDTVTIQSRLLDCQAKAPELLEQLYGGFLREGEELHTFLYGCFTTCVTLFNLVPAFTGIFGKSALPNVTSAWTRSDRERLRGNVESVIRTTSCVAAPMAFGLAFLAKPVLALLYGGLPGMIQVGAPLLSLLALASLCLALVSPANAIFQGIGRMDLPVKYLCAGAGVKLLLNLILVGIPSVNILGSALSTLACYGVIALLTLNQLRNVLTVRLDFGGILVKPLICGLICGISAFLCWNALTKYAENSIITLISAAVGGLAYVFSLGALRVIAPEDIFMLPNGKKIAKVLEKMRFIR